VSLRFTFSFLVSISCSSVPWGSLWTEKGWRAVAYTSGHSKIYTVLKNTRRDGQTLHIFIKDIATGGEGRIPNRALVFLPAWNLSISYIHSYERRLRRMRLSPLILRPQSGLLFDTWLRSTDEERTRGSEQTCHSVTQSNTNLIWTILGLKVKIYEA
jgi:hypothetical protein